jgi:hypothetical protein
MIKWEKGVYYRTWEEALEAKDRRIAKLEADLTDYATAIGQNEQLRKDNERLRAVATHAARYRKDPSWQRHGKNLDAALAAVDGDGDE